MENSKPLLNDFRGIGFDLDNTLYDEFQYYENALPELYEKFFKGKSISFNSLSDVYFSILQEKGKHYGFLFNEILEKFGIFSPTNLSVSLELFKRVGGRLTLFESVSEILNYLKKTHILKALSLGAKAC